MTLWLTGFSGSGKSAIGEAFVKKHPGWVLLDGDIMRKGLCSDLGFSDEDRIENLRRIIEVCKLLTGYGKNIVTAFISPFEIMRERAKCEIEDCHVVWCKANLETCEMRDPKGIYAKARAGKIKDFTGIDSPFEVPAMMDLILNTGEYVLEECLSVLEQFVLGRGSE